MRSVPALFRFLEPLVSASEGNRALRFEYEVRAGGRLAAERGFILQALKGRPLYFDLEIAVLTLDRSMSRRTGFYSETFGFKPYLKLAQSQIEAGDLSTVVGFSPAAIGRDGQGATGRVHGTDHFAPAFLSSATILLSPLSLALISGVAPATSLIWTSAPCANRSFTLSIHPSETANINAKSPSSRLALTPIRTVR